MTQWKLPKTFGKGVVDHSNQMFPEIQLRLQAPWQSGATTPSQSGVDLGAMVMKGYSAFPKASALMKLPYLIV